MRFVERRDQTYLEILDKGRVKGRYPTPYNIRPGDLVPFVRACANACNLQQPENLLKQLQTWVDKHYAVESRGCLTIIFGEEAGMHRAELLHLSWDELEVSAKDGATEIHGKSLDGRFIADQSLVKWTILFRFSGKEEAELFSRRISEQSTTVVCQGFWSLGITGFNAERWVTIGVPTSGVKDEAAKRGVELRQLDRKGMVGRAFRVVSKHSSSE